MSQCDRILAVLSDGRPHEMREIHARAGFMRLNSRISELRGRGYRIECDKTGGQYVYTLISRPLEGGAGTSLGVPACHAPASPLSGCVSDVLPTHEAPRVEASVTAVSPQPLFGDVVQRSERRPVEAEVAGSNPVIPAWTEPNGSEARSPFPASPAPVEVLASLTAVIGNHRSAAATDAASVLLLVEPDGQLRIAA